MDRPYLVLVNGVVWEKKASQHFALKVIRELNEKWEAMGSKMRAVLGYALPPAKL